MSNRSLILRWEVFKHLREVGLISGAYFLYMFVRKFLIPNIEPTAFENAARVIDFELAAGFFWEPAWQSWAIESAKGIVVFLNWTYIVTFWPIIITTGLIMYVVDRSKYHYFRNVVLLSFVLALILFAAFPLAPPRYLPEYGFVDTIQRFGPTWYGGREMHVYYNAFAAMPSLHFGWTVLFGVLFFTVKNRWVKPLGIIYPTMTFLAITVTGNHYILDAVGGAVVICASFGLYYLLQRIGARQPEIVSKLKPTLAQGAASVRLRLGRWRAGAKAAQGNLADLVSPERRLARSRKLAFASAPPVHHRKGHPRRRHKTDR